MSAGSIAYYVVTGLLAIVVIAWLNTTNYGGEFKARYCADPAHAGGFTCRVRTP